VSLPHRRPLPFPRRQVLIWIVAVFLPCIMLVALALRMLMQERELAEKRATDFRRLRATEVARDLVDRLEAIKRAEVRRLGSNSLADSATVVVARVVSGSVVLPWYDDPQATRFAIVRDAGEFGEQVRRGARAEHANRQYAEAARLYAAARAAARDPLQVAYAELLVARATTSMRPNAGVQAFIPVAQRGVETRDESGVPLALYAFHRLSADLAQRLELRRAFEKLTAAMASSRWTSPAACYATLGLDDRLSRLTRARCDELARAEGLAQDGTLASALQQSVEQSSSAQIWLRHGTPTWLASMGRSAAGADVLVVVRLDALLRGPAVRLPLGATLVTAEVPDAPSLGPDLPGLWLAGVDVAAGGLDMVRAFYLVSVTLALSVGLFGAYLVWRDVQRELGLAHLRSQFVAGVTHELKTPLTAIRMFAETLRERVDVPRQLREEYLDTIVGEAERLSRLLNNVLDFSRIEQGQRPYRLEPGDLRDGVRAALRAMKYPLERQQFVLNVEDDGTVLPVRIDADAIEQAVLNLITNAMKYSTNGRALVVRLARGGEYASVSVRDDGVGIATEEHARIFEKFYRVRSPMNEAASGAGLGLTLVEHIAHAHGGRITVQSQPGQGSTFTLWIPVAAQDSNTPLEAAARPAEVSTG
jgi:signal transduction histidine kinase